MAIMTRHTNHHDFQKYGATWISSVAVLSTSPDIAERYLTSKVYLPEGRLV